MRKLRLSVRERTHRVLITGKTRYLGFFDAISSRYLI